MPHPRPTLGGRRSHASPEANLGQEMQSRLARGQPWEVTVTTYKIDLSCNYQKVICVLLQRTSTILDRSSFCRLDMCKQ
jgi:hypothetical protein